MTIRKLNVRSYARNKRAMRTGSPERRKSTRLKDARGYSRVGKSISMKYHRLKSDR